MKKLTSSIIPRSTWIRLITVWLVVLSFSLMGKSVLHAEMLPVVAVGGFLILLSAILYASFGVVREADHLASKLGEPYGTLILTLSVVSIEVILISAVLLGPGENPSIGKDSIFSVMMIILNLVLGLSILIGGLKFGEQEYNIPGSVSYLAMIVLLGSVGMILPNYLNGTRIENPAEAGLFLPEQAITLSILVVLLYASFLYFQMKTYKHHYIQPPKGKLEISFLERTTLEDQNLENENSTTRNKEIWIRALILISVLVPIALMSHDLAIVVDYGIKASGLPHVLGGVLIALIVFTPESITSLKATLKNEFQRTINLCQGAFVSTVSLSIPAILIVGLISGKTVQFGLNNTETLLFFATISLSMMTIMGRRTSPMIGVMHLFLFAVFIMHIIH